MHKKIHILLLEDHGFISLGVQIILEQTFKEALIFKTVTDADAALEYLQRYPVDILLLDLILKSEYKTRLDSGDELLREIYLWEDKPKTIVLSKIDSLDMLNYCIEQLEADAYIFKSKTSVDEIIPAINAVLDNEYYYSYRIKKLLKYQFGLLEMDTTDRIILKELSNGLYQKEIVSILEEKEMSISVSAVEKRIRKLKLKFEANTTSHLVAIAIRKGII
jgi:DNA-binding NarL/FixJ family response regulator